jgi:hypothetical protein
MKLTMNDHSISNQMAALTGFMLAILNHYTGMFNTAFLFQYFSNEVFKAFMLGAVGAFGGLTIRMLWSYSVRAARRLFASKKNRNARK